MPARYFNPVRCIVGDGALESLPEIVGTRSAALVTFPEARALGMVERIEAMLGGRLRTVIDSVSPNPDVADLALLHSLFWRGDAECEVIIALGGGSCIDTAKVVMVEPRGGGFGAVLAALEAGKTFVPARRKVLIAIPTTAGTGSEVTPWATVWDRRRQHKYSLHLAQTWADVALVDPQLMATLPECVTLHTGLDALSHALESIWNTNANPVSDTFAVAATHDILAGLPRLMQNPASAELRATMAVAALRAGLAFSNTATALAHSISYDMTLRLGLPHGLACSFTLPMVLERAIGQRSDRDHVLTQALGPLHAAPVRLERFLHDLGVKTRFEDYGLDAAQASELVAHALQGPRGRNFIGAELAVPA